MKNGGSDLGARLVSLWSTVQAFAFLLIQLLKKSQDVLVPVSMCFFSVQFVPAVCFPSLNSVPYLNYESQLRSIHVIFLVSLVIFFLQKDCSNDTCINQLVNNLTILKVNYAQMGAMPRRQINSYQSRYYIVSCHLFFTRENQFDYIQLLQNSFRPGPITGPNFWSTYHFHR